MAFSEASRTLLIAIAGLTLASGAHAATITTFNTGVNGSGTPLADGAIGDPHYLLTAVPSGSTTAIRVRTSVGGYPIGPWLADDTISAWIGPNNDAQVDGPVGNYDYRTTFNLTGFNPATASLTGRWSTDNPGINILINGASTGITAGGFTAWSPLSITSGFVSGLNTLDFVVSNEGGPTGLRVEITGTATAIPEPGSLSSLLLAGVGAVCLGVRRRFTDVFEHRRFPKGK